MEVHLPREKAKLNILEGEKEVPSGIDITVARQLTPDHTRISAVRTHRPPARTPQSAGRL